MATDIRVVLGWVEQPVIKPHGGRAQTRASNIKDAAAERLEALVRGTAVGRGVENTDSLKAGDLLPVPRLESALARIGALRARIDGALRGSAETDAKAQARADLVEGLRRRLADAKTEALSIWRDMPPEMGSPELAIRLMSAVGSPQFTARPVVASPAPRVSAGPERCPSCRRLLSPPKGVFGCDCKVPR